MALQEPDHREEAEVEDGEVGVRVVSDILDADRGDLLRYCQSMSSTMLNGLLSMLRTLTTRKVYQSKC